MTRAFSQSRATTTTTAAWHQPMPHKRLQTCWLAEHTSMVNTVFTWHHATVHGNSIKSKSLQQGANAPHQPLHRLPQLRLVIRGESEHRQAARPTAVQERARRPRLARHQHPRDVGTCGKVSVFCFITDAKFFLRLSVAAAGSCAGLWCVHCVVYASCGCWASAWRVCGERHATCAGTRPMHPPGVTGCSPCLLRWAPAV